MKKHTLTRNLLVDWLSDQTNRHPRQTLFLLDLLEGDFRKLVRLEMQLKNCFCFYCPGDLEEVEKVLALRPGTNLLHVQLSDAIKFKEGQLKIYLGKHKIVPSSLPGYLDFHIVCPANPDSGYNTYIPATKNTPAKVIENKFARIVTLANIYSMDLLKNISPDNFEGDLHPELKYFENGGYLYDKKTF